MFVMRALGIKTVWIVRYNKISACCSVTKYQRLRMAPGFLSSIAGTKSVNSRDQTAKVWCCVDTIRSQNTWESRSDFWLRLPFFHHLGPPFDRLLQPSNNFRNAKKCSRLLLQYRPPKRVPKKWFCLESPISTWSGFQKGGGLSFYGMKLGYSQRASRTEYDSQTDRTPDEHEN